MKGVLSASDISFKSKTTIVDGVVQCAELALSNTVINNGNMYAHKGRICGRFTNNGISKFERELELYGDISEIFNTTEVEAYELKSNAKTGIVSGGNLKIQKANVAKHLQIENATSSLTSVEIQKEAALLLTDNVRIPALNRINNHGQASIFSETANLQYLASTGHLQLENASIISRVISLDELQGISHIKAKFPNVTALTLQSGASLDLLPGAELPQLTNMTISKDAIINAAHATIGEKSFKNLYNFGSATFNTDFSSLEAVYNAKDGTICFMEHATINGRDLSETDRSVFPLNAYLDNTIALFNEGAIVIKNKGLCIKKKYVASKGAMMRLEDTSRFRAGDIVNDGTIYSPTNLNISQHRGFTRFGRCVSEDGMLYDCDHLILDGSFSPTIKGSDKTLKINSKNDVTVTRDMTMNVDLDIEASKLQFQADLKSRSIEAVTDVFLIDKQPNKKVEVSAKDHFNILTKDFTNVGGRLQTEGKSKSQLNVTNKFVNTGGGERVYKQQSVTWYTCNPTTKQLEPHVSTRDTYVYDMHLEDAGVIVTGGLLDINAEQFNNSFGIINAMGGLFIETPNPLMNECGLIYSGGKSTIIAPQLNNGYILGTESFEGVDPHNPMYENRARKTTEYRDEVEMVKRNRVQRALGMGRKSKITRKSVTVVRNEKVLVGYKPRSECNLGSAYPGYIFSNGDLHIETLLPSYVGTIVSGGDIYFKGTKQRTCNSADFGTLICKGNVTMELEKAALNAFAIQAQNIYINLMKDLIIDGVVLPVQLPTGQVVQLINLQKLGRQLGFMNEQTLLTRESASRSPSSSVSRIPGSVSPIYSSSEAGFFGSKPTAPVFMSSLPEDILHQLILLTLTPIYGRDILLNINITAQLRKAGVNTAGALEASQDIVLKNGDPAILFDKSVNPDIEKEIDGQLVSVPLYDPYLVTNVISKVINKIQAERLIKLSSAGSIKLTPGDISLDSKDLDLESQKHVEIESEFKYSKSGRTSVKPVVLHREGSINISGREGVTTRGAHIVAKNIRVHSSDGNVTDMDMPLDMSYTHTGNSTSGYKKTETSTFSADSVTFSAPKGKIEQCGTVIDAGTDGVTIEGLYSWKPSYEERMFSQWNRKGATSTRIRTPKDGGIISKNTIVINSADASLIGATIIASKIENISDGNLRFRPSYMEQETHSVAIKNRLFGSSQAKFDQHRKTPISPKIIADTFKAHGIGTVEMEGVVAKIVDASITKTLEDRASYEQNYTSITRRSSGFFSPKIKGDIFIDALKQANSAVTLGDAIPAAFNVIGTGAETLKHATQLANLSKMGDPMAVIGNIFLTRFVSGFGYHKIRTTHETDEKTPVQSKVDIELLRVNNDRTHLEGVWSLKKGDIETKKFTTKAPERLVKQRMRTSGYSISFSPTAFIAACINPTAATLAGGMPTVSVINSKRDISCKEHVAQIISADELFIRCDNAVFSGSQIRARLIDALVTENITIEDLRREFSDEAIDNSFSIALSGVASLMQTVQPGLGLQDPRFKAIPHMRFANERSLSRSVQHLSELVGTEKFYLKVGKLLHTKSAVVGLRPDGIVANSDAERIEAGKILNETIEETDEHHRHVFNPCLAEFFGMVSRIEDLKAVQREIEHRAYQDALFDGKTTSEAEKESQRKHIEFEQDVNEALSSVECTAEDIIKLDETLKTKASASNVAKSKAIVDCLKTLARKQAELETKSDDNIVKQTALQTRLEAINTAKLKHLRNLGAIEQAEKIRHADEAVNDRKMLIWSQLDDPSVIDVSQIKLADEANIRQASDEKVARDFQRQRDIIEAEYRANVRFARGDRPVEFGMAVRFGIDGKTPARSASAREKDQLDVLRQEELRKCGEATEQRIARFIPFVGSGMECYYGRISGREALGLVALDAALGAIGKGLAAFKASTKALFEKNLSEQLMKPNVARPVGYSLRDILTTESDTLVAPQAKRVKLTPAASQAPERIDIIKEAEMVQKAAAMPGEWNGQFKLINEIPQITADKEFSSGVYCRQVLFKDPKSGQMFRVFQRNDIDPNYVIKEGTTKEIGRTNIELMLEGRAPYTTSGEKVIIHHMGQDAFGPFVEVTKRTHKSLLHNQFGYGQPHPTNPVIRKDFDPIREAYWRAYAEQFK